MNTIAITDLQKSPKKALEMGPFTYILANNKKRGMIINAEMMNFLEESGLIEEYEDWSLVNKFPEHIKEAQDIIKSGDYSKTHSFDEL